MQPIHRIRNAVRRTPAARLPAGARHAFRWRLPLLIVLVLAMGLGACGPAEPEPPAEPEQAVEEGPTPEDLAAEQARREAEQRRREEERRAAEEARLEALGPEMMAHDFSQEAEPEPDALAPEALAQDLGQEAEPEPGTSDEPSGEFRSLDDLLAEAGIVEPAPEEATEGEGEELAMVGAVPPPEPGPQEVRIGVLYQSGQKEMAAQIAVLIDSYQNKKLARAIGLPVKVAFISRAARPQAEPSLIRYREGSLQAAMKVANVLPDEQAVEPMDEAESAHASVDLFIYVGTRR